MLMLFGFLAVMMMLFSPVMAAPTDDAAGLFNKGAKAQTKKNFKEAISLYQASLKINSKNEPAYYNLADCHYQLSELADAKLNANKSLALLAADIEKAKTYYLLGNIAQKRNDGTACSYYKKAALNFKYKAQAEAKLKSLKCR